MFYPNSVHLLYIGSAFTLTASFTSHHNAHFYLRHTADTRYGGLADKGQFVYYANSTDGLTWDKPILNRFDLSNWNYPWAKQVGKHNNIIMAGGGLGMYRDLHDSDPKARSVQLLLYH